MNKLVPQFALKYTAPSMEACECFTAKMLPVYDKKYKKIIKSWSDDFKTLKHRSKK